jgi:putative nucleotidyltransferase with HDIG domain
MARPAEPHAGRDPAAGDGTPLVVCAWCNKVRVGDRWLVPMAMRAYTAAPTHGICPECYTSNAAARTPAGRPIAAVARPVPSIGWTAWIASDEWKDSIGSALPLTAVARDVLDVALDEHAPPTRVVKLVSSDPMLATRVLHLANSAYHSPSVQIVSVFDAIIRIGTGAARNVIAAACLGSAMRDPQVHRRHGQQLMDHSVGTAYLAWALAEAAGERADEAFLCGLLHDIGKFAILRLAREPRPHVARPDDAEVAAVMADRHAEIGGFALQALNLPERVREPVVCHHAPGRAVAFPRAASVTYTANRLAHRLGFGCDPEDVDVLADPVAQSIGLTAESLSRLDARAPELFELARTTAA